MTKDDDDKESAVGDSAGRAGGDPQLAVVRARTRLRELVTQLRDDVDTVADARARTLFATTADLLVVLEEAFADLEVRAETACFR